MKLKPGMLGCLSKVTELVSDSQDLDSGPPDSKMCTSEMITQPHLMPKSSPQDGDFIF